MKNKGFTLIELLAVIVILAIIALIATPIILGIINDARNSAKKRSAELVYTGVEYAYTSYLYKNSTTEVTDTITLEELKGEINIENVNKEENVNVVGNALQIETNDAVKCEVTQDTTAGTLTVKCGKTYGGEEYLSSKSFVYTATN